jgi:ATP-dependent RNA helicase DHX36
MILQFLQTDAILKNYSHIILDEIHERSVESDFIIAFLKLIIPKVRYFQFLHLKKKNLI